MYVREPYPKTFIFICLCVWMCKCVSDMWTSVQSLQPQHFCIPCWTVLPSSHPMQRQLLSIYLQPIRGKRTREFSVSQSFILVLKMEKQSKPQTPRPQTCDKTTWSTEWLQRQAVLQHLPTQVKLTLLSLISLPKSWLMSLLLTDYKMSSTPWAKIMTRPGSRIMSSAMCWFSQANTTTACLPGMRLAT